MVEEETWEVEERGAGEATLWRNLWSNSECEASDWLIAFLSLFWSKEMYRYIGRFVEIKTSGIPCAGILRSCKQTWPSGYKYWPFVPLLSHSSFSPSISLSAPLSYLLLSSVAKIIASSMALQSKLFLLLVVASLICVSIFILTKVNETLEPCTCPSRVLYVIHRFRLFPIWSFA